MFAETNRLLSSHWMESVQLPNYHNQAHPQIGFGRGPLVSERVQSGSGHEIYIKYIQLRLKLYKFSIKLLSFWGGPDPSSKYVPDHNQCYFSGNRTQYPLITRQWAKPLIQQCWDWDEIHSFVLMTIGSYSTCSWFNRQRGF